jgi:hypothetical protein
MQPVPEVTIIDTTGTAKRRRSLRLNGSDRLSALSTDLLVQICEFLVRQRGRHLNLCFPSLLRRLSLSCGTESSR